MGLLIVPQVRSAAEELIFIDPAHGGDDAGASTEYGTEAQFVLQTALLIEEALLAHSLNIQLSRRSDIALPPAHRMAKASKARAKFILSLHLANHKSSVDGPIIYYGADTNSNDLPGQSIFPLWRTPSQILGLAKDLALRLTVAAGLGEEQARPFPSSPWMEGTHVPVLLIELEALEGTTSGGGEISAQEVADFWSSSILLLVRSEEE